MKVIAISGKAGSGKTTLAEALVEKLARHKTTNYNVVVTEKFAKPLYQAQLEIQRILGKAAEKNRDILIGVADIAKKVYGEEVFTETLQDNLKAHETMLDYVIIDDMRYGHELDMLYQNFDVLTVRLDAPVSVLDTRVGVPANREHISETDLDNAMFDLYIDVNSKDQQEVLNEVISNL